MRLFTIGFPKKSAADFSGTLRAAGVKRVIDVRLNNRSQLAGFTKASDLAYFLRALCGIDYVARPDLAPSKALFDGYKKSSDWRVYKQQFIELMRERRVEEAISRDVLDGACLMCSEPEPDRCHRRLVAEYLRDKWGNVEIEHLR
jgi:uncharacterized protein (DUF488 family)